MLRASIMWSSRLARVSTLQQEIDQPAGAHEEERDDAAVQQTKVWLFGMVRRNERRFDIIAALPIHSERYRTHNARLSKPWASGPVRDKTAPPARKRGVGTHFVPLSLEI